MIFFRRTGAQFLTIEKFASGNIVIRALTKKLFKNAMWFHYTAFGITEIGVGEFSTKRTFDIQTKIKTFCLRSHRFEGILDFARPADISEQIIYVRTFRNSAGDFTASPLLL